MSYHKSYKTEIALKKALFTVALVIGVFVLILHWMGLLPIAVEIFGTWLVAGFSTNQ